jgi:FkbM family methyltransferase
LSTIPKWIENRNIRLVIAAFHEQFANPDRFKNNLLQLKELGKRPVAKLIVKPGEEYSQIPLWEDWNSSGIPTHLTPLEYDYKFSPSFLDDLKNRYLTSSLYNARFFRTGSNVSKLCNAGTNEMFEVNPDGRIVRCSANQSFVANFLDEPVVFNTEPSSCNMVGLCYCEWHHWSGNAPANDNETWTDYVRNGYWRLPDKAEFIDFINVMGWSGLSLEQNSTTHEQNNMITTNIPKFGPIDLVSYYDNFKDYYPNCEPATKQWFVENVQEDWMILDCGANIGYFSILFSKLATRGHIYAFEPTSTISMLQDNLAYHKVTNVTPLQCALGRTSGTKVDKIFRIWGRDPEQQEYPFISIDDFVIENNIPKIDCIKIDVDSFDFEVLQGAEQTLLKHDPYVMVELNHALNKRDQANTQALEWLARLGYTSAIVLDDDNFLLKRAPKNTSGKYLSITLNFPHAGVTAELEPVRKAAVAGARSTVPVSEYGIDIPLVHVFDLHSFLDFATPLDYPKSSLIKKFSQWKMEVDDAPIFRYIYRNAKPQRHLEFGTWQGKGTVFCLEECAATVWTINMPFGEGSYGFYAHELPDAHAWAQKVGMAVSPSYSSDAIGFIGKEYLQRNLGNRVCQIYSDSREWDAANFPEGFFDTILVDGGHTAEVVASDTRKALPLLRSGGIIMWHDFCATDYQRFEACRGVMDGVASEWTLINEQTTSLFWIYPSMILVGIKK